MGIKEFLNVLVLAGMCS